MATGDARALPEVMEGGRELGVVLLGSTAGEHNLERSDARTSLSKRTGINTMYGRGAACWKRLQRSDGT